MVSKKFYLNLKNKMIERMMKYKEDILDSLRRNDVLEMDNLFNNCIHYFNSQVNNSKCDGFKLPPKFFNLYEEIELITINYEDYIQQENNNLNDIKISDIKIDIGTEIKNIGTSFKKIKNILDIDTKSNEELNIYINDVEENEKDKEDEEDEEDE